MAEKREGKKKSDCNQFIVVTLSQVMMIRGKDKSEAEELDLKCSFI